MSDSELVGSVIDLSQMGSLDQREWLYPRDRRCPEPGCITYLCQFNPGPKCFVHTAKEQARERSRLQARDGFSLAA